MKPKKTNLQEGIYVVIKKCFFYEIQKNVFFMRYKQTHICREYSN